MKFATQPWRDRRLVDRHPVTLEARARKMSGPVAPVNITDISTEGFAIRGLEPYTIGTEILIYLPGLSPKYATVIWQRDKRTGAQFLDPLHPAVVEHLARQFR